MTIRKRIIPFFAAAGLAVAGCAATDTSESTGQYVDSTVVSTKVRAAIASDDMLSIFPIDVATYKGNVQLSGFVESYAQKSRAEEVAMNVKGVKSVDNDLNVRKDEE